jgi:5-methylcytosine-specific restriction endonuclease McrA
VVSGHLEYGPDWPKQRARALRRDAWKCQECGLTMNAHRSIWNGEGLHVHHVEKLREFDTPEAANRLENLLTVCRRCHHLFESRYS